MAAGEAGSARLLRMPEPRADACLLLNYILRRLLIALPSLLGISVVLFTVLALAPGDPFEDLANNPNVPPEVRMALRAQFGLDDPIWQRYLQLADQHVAGRLGLLASSAASTSTS